MSDSNARDRLDAKHDGDRQQRLEAVKRWADYIDSVPPEVWGPQQNAVVDDQLDAAQQARTSASHQQHVKRVAQELSQSRTVESASESSDDDDRIDDPRDESTTSP
ncbi:hypothetical protein [Saliphagus infecundisoli]|uniref:Uncharacterized protein n=1 Tax=Saliphagus infecundisoli TaxID=1849069 RepID=A0ABD5QAT2_9EURY|nr:hypothetical protein [Saliphagus infecundisoli]